jgi:hypothetical protein
MRLYPPDCTDNCSGRGGFAGAARILRRGGLVRVPTETVYACGRCASDAPSPAPCGEGKAKVNRHRPCHEPWKRRLRQEAFSAMPAPRRNFAGHRAGGSRARARRNDCAASRAGQKIALRVPAHPVVLAVIAAGAAPCGAFGQSLRPDEPGHRRSRRAGSCRQRPDPDGGRCPVGVESTIIESLKPHACCGQAGSRAGHRSRACHALGNPWVRPSSAGNVAIPLHAARNCVLRRQRATTPRRASIPRDFWRG